MLFGVRTAYVIGPFVLLCAIVIAAQTVDIITFRAEKGSYEINETITFNVDRYRWYGCDCGYGRLEIERWNGVGKC